MNVNPSMLLRLLRTHCPEWATGQASRGLLLRHLHTLLHAGTPDPLPVARQIAMWRWQLLPWDLTTQHLCARLGLHAPAPHENATEKTIPFAQAMHAVATGDATRVEALWCEHGQHSGSVLWYAESALFFLQRGDETMVRTILETPGIAQHHPVCTLLRALQAFVCMPPDQASEVCAELQNPWIDLRDYLQAELLLRQEHPSGQAKLLDLWRRMPWHTNLTLKLHSLLSPAPVRHTPDQRTAVLVYSWNNAELLRATLDSLSSSTLGQAKLFVLDNGSSDHTPEVIRAAAARLGEGLCSMRLPVNIGAPAARNWLLYHPQTSAFPNIVFVDDDVLVQKDWLEQMLAAHTSHTTIVGCRIMDQTPRQSVQMADVNLLDCESDGDFQIANAGSGELDLGLHHYARPCLSVTGCCHLMNRERAITLGGFDIRFNPSQFDDFELDLRNALDNGHAVYAGRTAIRHCQRSSQGQADTEAKQGHIHGNLFKLNTKFTPEQKSALIRRNRELLWNDLLAKMQDLENL